MRFRLPFEPVKCPHCGEWIRTPEQVERERKIIRGILWIIMAAFSIMGVIVIITEMVIK